MLLVFLRHKGPLQCRLSTCRPIFLSFWYRISDSVSINYYKKYWNDVKGAYLHIGVQGKVVGLVAKGKVVLGELRLLCVKLCVRAGEPALVLQYRCNINNGTRQVQVQVGVDGYSFICEWALEFTSLAPEKWNETSILTALSIKP